MIMSFTHLHIHSHYSLLDGLAKIDQLIEKAKKCNMNSLALTDHGVMYGAIEFYQKAKAAGIKPIIGVEAYLAPNGRKNKRPRIDERPCHLVLLAKDELGYKNLIKLTTLAHLEGFYYKPRIDWEILETYHQGLIALSACLKGEIPQAIIKGDLKKAKDLVKRYRGLFGPENFYLEVQYHPNLKEQALVNRALFDLAAEHNVGVVATNDVHYIEPEDREIQDILLCLQTKKKKTDTNRLRMEDDFSMRTPQLMKQAFRDHPEVIANTEKVAGQCNLEIEIGKTKLPYFPLPEGKSADQYLKELCLEGIKNRFGRITPTLRERLEYELGIIGKTGFASYLLIVQDFVNWAKTNEIQVGPGRGSAAGSIICYGLNITNVDPIKYGLIFERFLNPERISMPDIDLDFTDTRRDEVIHYVEDKYGKDHVAQIITFGTMAARAAVRDVGRVLDFPYNFCDRLAKMIPPFMNLDKALQNNLELKTFYETNPDAKKIIDSAQRLEGVARHSSRHACGVVITPEPLAQYLPVQYDVSGGEKTIISQYEMHAIEDLGLLKMDFLGLKNLTVLETACKIIKRTKEKEINLDQIPLDDKKTFALLKKAECIGIFQMESDGMRRYLKQLKPTEIEDIIAMVALYRPGPIELIPDYIAGKHGLKTPTYLHPKLKPILEKTCGVCVYQEQVLQIARDLAGFTLGEADVLRKAVGKKIRKLLKTQKEKFIQGCIKNKVPKDTAEKVFAFIEPFAGYGFNKSHATCYATIAYQTAYLKANYPTEFMAALLASDQDDLDRIAIEVEEAQRMSIEVLPPDINESMKNFTVTGENEIRFGLLAVKNIGAGIVQAIIEERKKNGHFQNLEDFLTRLASSGLNKKSLESLTKCGALDSFGERNQMLASMDSMLSFAKSIQKEKEGGQTSFFGIISSPFKGSGFKLKKAEPAPEITRLTWEKELLGLFISSHPFKQFEQAFKEITTFCNQLSERQVGSHVRMAGVITQIKKITTSTKETMLFVKIEDTTGNIEILVFPSLLKENISVWQENKVVLVTGRLSDKDGVLKILGGRVQEITSENIEKIKQENSNKYDFCPS
jgi:DNA polymerase-3 subunit alpha